MARMAGGAAKLHCLIQQPIGFQAARWNAVDEQLNLRETWAAIWRANTRGLFHRPTIDAMHRILRPFRAVTGLGYDAVPPRALNELPDQLIEALIDLIMRIEQKMRVVQPLQSLRLDTEGSRRGATHRPPLRHRTRAVQASSHRGQGVGGLQHGGFLLGHARAGRRALSSVVSGSRPSGVHGSAADGHAVATILCDLLKAFDHVAHQKLIDAAVRTRFPVRQLKLLLQLYQALWRVELEGVVCDALKAHRGIQLLLVGPLREVSQAHPIVSIRVVVDDLSLQRFGDHNRVAHELELPSTCMASKLAQAGCEVATKKSKVLSNSVFVRAKLQLRFVSLGVQAVRVERYLGIDFTSGKRASTAVRRARLEKSTGRVKTDQEDPWQVVSSAAATAGEDRARFGIEGEPLWRCSHWAQ